MSACLFSPFAIVTVGDDALTEVLRVPGTGLAWLLLDVTVSKAVDLVLRITGPAGAEDITVTVARSARICVEATDLRLLARARTGSAVVSAGLRLDREQTANLLDVAVAEASAPGTLTPIPARAVAVVLDCPKGDRGTAYLELVDGAGITRGSLPASAVGVLSPVGAAESVLTVCNSPHRLIFHLSL